MRFSGGYYYKKVTDHPHAMVNRGIKYVKRSHLVVEKILGKYLPKGVAIHHVDGDRSNDSPKNLIVCENDSFHKTLERRTRAFQACGHADWEKCYFCKEYDDPKNLYIYRPHSAIHWYCLAKKNKDYQKRKRKMIIANC